MTFDFEVTTAQPPNTLSSQIDQLIMFSSISSLLLPPFHKLNEDTFTIHCFI